MTQQSTAEHLSQLSVQCGGAPLVLQELEQLAEEAGLKHLLWTMQQDMAAATAAWLKGPLFEQDVAQLQTQVGCSWAATEFTRITLLWEISIVGNRGGSKHSRVQPMLLVFPKVRGLAAGPFAFITWTWAVTHTASCVASITVVCRAVLQVDQFSRQVHKLERGLAPNSLVPKLREEVNRWQVSGCDHCGK